MTGNDTARGAKLGERQFEDHLRQAAGEDPIDDREHEDRDEADQEIQFDTPGAKGEGGPADEDEAMPRKNAKRASGMNRLPKWLSIKWLKRVLGAKRLEGVRLDQVQVSPKARRSGPKAVVVQLCKGGVLRVITEAEARADAARVATIGSETWLAEHGFPSSSDVNFSKAAMLDQTNLVFRLIGPSKVLVETRAEVDLRAKLQSDRERHRVEEQNRLEEMRLKVTEIEKELACAPLPDWLPPRERLEAALLLFAPGDFEILKMLRAAPQTPEDDPDDPFQHNEVVSLADPSCAPKLDAAVASGRLIIAIARKRPWASTEATLGINFASWSANQSTQVYVIRQRHAVWRNEERNRRMGWRDGAPAEFQLLGDYEESEDLGLWRSTAGVARWIRWGHVERVSREACVAYVAACAAESERERIEEHRALKRSIVGNRDALPSFTSAEALLRANDGGVRYLVQNLLPREGICGLFGAPEQGKSRIAASLAAAAAMGKSWCGMAVNDGRPAQVAYFALEDPTGVAADILAHATTHEERAQIIRNVHITADFPKVIGSVSDHLSVRRFGADIHLNFGCQLAVFDTYTALLARNGADAVAGAGPIVDGLREFIAETGATVVLLGHTKKYDAEDEGTALRRAADVMVPVARESVVDGQLVVRLRVGSELAKFRFRARHDRDLLLTFRKPSPDGGLALVEHQEVQPQLSSQRGSGNKAGRPSKVDKILTALAACNEPVAGLQAIAELTGVGRSTCGEILSKLVAQGKIEARKRGKETSWSIVRPSGSPTSRMDGA